MKRPRGSNGFGPGPEERGSRSRTSKRDASSKPPSASASLVPSGKDLTASLATMGKPEGMLIQDLMSPSLTVLAVSAETNPQAVAAGALEALIPELRVAAHAIDSLDLDDDGVLVGREDIRRMLMAIVSRAEVALELAGRVRSINHQRRASRSS